MGGESNDRGPPPPPVPPPLLYDQSTETRGAPQDLPPPPPSRQEREMGGVGDDPPPPPPVLNGEENENGGLGNDQPPPPPVLNGEGVRCEIDKSSEAYQLRSWKTLRKDITFQVNRVADIMDRADEELDKQAAPVTIGVTEKDLADITFHLLSLNLVRGRGILSASLIAEQLRRPQYTEEYAALAARVNYEFPEVGNLLVRRLIVVMRAAYKISNQTYLLAVTTFIAHLVNQRVVHEPGMLIILDNAIWGNLEVAVRYFICCGEMLQYLFPEALDEAIRQFCFIKDDNDWSNHKYHELLITHLLRLYEDNFEGIPSIREGMLFMGAQSTHSIRVDDRIDPELDLDDFKQSNSFLEEDEAYEERKRRIQVRTEQRRHIEDDDIT